jgi:hypothetical protein
VHGWRRDNRVEEGLEMGEEAEGEGEVGRKKGGEGGVREEGGRGEEGQERRQGEGTTDRRKRLMYFLCWTSAQLVQNNLFLYIKYVIHQEKNFMYLVLFVLVRFFFFRLKFLFYFQFSGF